MCFKIKCIFKLKRKKLWQNVKSLNIKPRSYDKLKVGFLSNDLREHPVGYFVIDVIKNIKGFSTVAFNLFKSNNNENKIIKELKNSFSEWYDVADLNSDGVFNVLDIVSLVSEILG